MRASKIYSVSDQEFIKIVENSHSYSDCLKALGLSSNGGSSTDVLKERIRSLGCSTDHFRGRNGGTANRRYSLDQILVKDSTYKNIPRLKERLIRESLLEYKCQICGISEWQNKPISLQLDHINGCNTDNRLENLRLLCPNCHSQTDTYAGKNKNVGVA